MRKEAEAWLKISAEDLQSAEVLFERKLFRMACYHAQQSVEKVLKALLADREVHISKAQNIDDFVSDKLGKENVKSKDPQGSRRGFRGLLIC